ncbi:methylmalonic aciduria and homocystinuria type D protein [Leptolyngbya sp. FACHB-36]|uniref:methylmalonic aciduria and homocystinuria type D protein n=1 Tax=Leptolyngbya sp. FACHB-36 TaxID=2692808 RepID=UPI001681841D|nr:methylmalonic aciduria and homocystinuria type D protein [Leptolyngbya sp. FACHB-36]MBD2019644.1 methylmalonic aciduria and homocystinuria type D protein [Leptolyngbya sp. FACHB-36]
MQYSVHSPNEFIATHRPKLLPDWSCPVASVLVVLQSCPCELLQRTQQAEVQKQTLRQRFLSVGYEVATKLERMGYLADVFDPKTGRPLRSRPGPLRLDDVAVVRSCLGYPILDRNGCSVLLHPAWGSAVYPSTIVSSAAPDVLDAVFERSLSECHQLLTSGGKLTE